MFVPSPVLDPAAVGGAWSSLPASPRGSDIAAGMLWGELEVRGEVRACFVSRISNFAAMLRVTGDIARNDAVTLRLEGVPPVAASVRAVEGGRVRLSFCRPVALTPTPGARRAAVPGARYGADVPGRFRLGALLAAVRVIDISQGGAKLALAEPVEVDALGLLNFTGAGEPLASRVRWCHGGRAGVQFVQPLARPDLDCMLAFIRANRAEGGAKLR